MAVDVQCLMCYAIQWLLFLCYCDVVPLVYGCAVLISVWLCCAVVINIDKLIQQLEQAGYNMNDSSFEQSIELKDKSFYEDLSSLIQIFKKIINNIDQIIHHQHSQQDSTTQLQNIKNIISTHQPLISKHAYPIPDQPHLLNTYYRFIYRLTQIVTVFRNKLLSKNIKIDITTHLLQQIEDGIHQEKHSKNITNIFKKTFGYLLKFCTQCETYGLKQGLQTELKEPLGKSKEGSSQLSKQPRILWHNSQSNFQKTMNKLNRRFFTMRCLDIDYNAFKASFFSVKNENSEFYTDCMRRNDFAKQQIHNYSREFEEYLKRRERIRLVRKNRLMEGKKVERSYTLEMNAKDYSQNNKNETNIGEKTVQEDCNSQSCSQTKILWKNRLKQHNKTESQLKPIQRQGKRKNYFQIKNVSIILNQPKQSNYIQNNFKNADSQANSKQKSQYEIIRTSKIPSKSSKFIEPEDTPAPENYHSFLDIRQYDYNKHKITNVGMEQWRQGKRMVCNVKQKGNVLESKNIRITQLSSPVKNKRRSIKMITQEQ